MVEDDEEHGEGAEKYGEGVELVVGYHAGRTTRKRRLLKEGGHDGDTRRWPRQSRLALERCHAVCESASYLRGYD